MTSELDAFAGQESFAAPPEAVLRAITDPDTLAAAIPDKVAHERIDDRTLRCTVSPGFSFLRANLKLHIAIARPAPAEVTMHITSTAIGASMKVECGMRVEPEGSGSRIHWRASVVQRSGLLSAVSPSLIRGAADKVLRDGWTAMHRQIDAQPPG